MVSMNEILTNARKGQYAVGSFNVTNTVFVDAVLEAAADCRSPIIVSVAERHVEKGFVNLADIAGYIKMKAANFDIPVAMHLDHGQTIECIKQAIDLGFTSVMLDRSSVSLAENIKDTQTVLAMCKQNDVSVEGEIGAISGEEGESKENVADASMFTEPQVAADYIEQTGIHALAVSIGNVHGCYKGEPNLDFELLAKIKDTVSIPLVLHGGSGISDNDFRKMIRYGINKINFYSGNVQCAYRSMYEIVNTKPLENGSDITALFHAIYKAVYKTAKEQMLIFGSNGKA